MKKALKVLYKEIPMTYKLIILSLALSLFLLFGCEIYKKMNANPDSIAEELAEELTESVIKEYIGLEVDLDFTPSSPEN